MPSKVDAALARNRKRSTKIVKHESCDVNSRCKGCNGMVHVGEPLRIEITYEGDRAMLYRRFCAKCKP